MRGNFMFVPIPLQCSLIPDSHLPKRLSFPTLHSLSPSRVPIPTLLLPHCKGRLQLAQGHLLLLQLQGSLLPHVRQLR